MKKTEIDNGVEYSHPNLNLPQTVKSRLLVTTVRVIHDPGHDRVYIWNRGGLAGVMTVNEGDGEAFARRLLRDD